MHASYFLFTTFRAELQRIILCQDVISHFITHLQDQDGSGAIDADELGAAFKLLGACATHCVLVMACSKCEDDCAGEAKHL